MASAIDATKPVAGNPTTESVRANFAAAKSEIEVLQQTAGVGPQGPVGPTGPSGTLSVGTVTTGAAGTSAAVTNSGTTQAAVLNFTIPRGDAGTGGGGITETQAKDAVAAGNIKFLESPESLAVSFPTTPNLAGAPTAGAGWTPETGGTATQAYTHNTGGGANPLAYPATISNGTFYQIVWSMTRDAATTGISSYSNVLQVYFRNGASNTTGQQAVAIGALLGTTTTVLATGNFTHVVVVPENGWQGTFTLTRVVAYTGAQNSISLRIKDWDIRARTTSLYIGSGGTLATSSGNVSLGMGTNLAVITSGSNNIAIGLNAFPRLGSASNNIGLGQVGQYLVSGGTNIGIGDYSVYSYKNPGQSNNIAIGQYTQYYGSSGSSYNICIGEWVGFRGANNVGIGYLALAHSSGPPGELLGSNNVGVGMRAGAYITSNAQNTACDNSVFVGAATKAHADAETNQTVIGYNALGHGSNTITLGDSNITALHCQVQTISALSDIRVKENIEPANLERCFAAVKNLPVYRWAWQAIAGTHRDKHVTGFLADDVSKIWPKAVTKEDAYLTVRNADGTPQMTNPPTPPASDDGEPDAPWKKEPKGPPPLVEKTQEFKDLQYVCLTEILPTLWGAVQYLIQKVEQMQIQPGSAQP